MTEFQLRSTSGADLDVEAAFEWYEKQKPGLGFEFLDELNAAYDQIISGPLKYQDLEGGIRRVLLRRFPYAAYFSIEGDAVVVITVLHANRDPELWQRWTSPWQVHDAVT